MPQAGGWIDDKVVTARRLLRQGATLRDMIVPLGYKSMSGVRTYLRSMGLPLPEHTKRKHNGRRKP